MKIGIVWLPNVGKSTLFNALTKSYAADAANFPFCTIEPNVGIVDVKDPRLESLSTMSNSQKIVYATISFVDIAWLVKGASSGEWLGNKFLSHIREVDAIVQVLRYFQDANVSHVEWSVDPMRDVEIINTELIMSDLEQIENKLPAIAKKASSAKDKDSINTAAALTKAIAWLRAWKLVYDIRHDMTPDEYAMLQPYNLLTDKSFVYAINVWQDDLSRADEIQAMFAEKLHKTVVVVCATIESEMMTLSSSDRDDFVRELLGISHASHIPTLDDLIGAAFREVWLMYYFTTGEKESRAWTIPVWSTAPKAAAAIHTDFEKWFIKAEVIHCEDLLAAWSRAKAREWGKMKLQWKDYVVQDGDVIIFKFNV